MHTRWRPIQYLALALLLYLAIHIWIFSQYRSHPWFDGGMRHRLGTPVSIPDQHAPTIQKHRPSASLSDQHAPTNENIQKNSSAVPLGSSSERPPTHSNVAFTMDDFEQVAVSIAKKTGLVLFTVVNTAYLDLAFSWLCNTAALHADLHQHVLLLTTEVSAEERLLRQWPELHVVSMNSSQYLGSLKYSTAGYVRLMVERTRLIQSLLQANVRLLLFEFDFVWLADPLPTILSESEKSKSDIVATKVYGKKLVCGCFLLMNPTSATKSLWTNLTEKMDALNEHIGHASQSRAVSEGTNDQTYLSSLINKRHSDVRVGVLSERLFPDGQWYKKAILRSLKPDPLIIHNNWIIGADAKIKRAKKFGHWFLSDSSADSDVDCNMTAVRKLLSH